MPPALARGGELHVTADARTTVAKALAARIAKNPRGVVQLYRPSGQPRQETFDGLWQRSGVIAAALRARGIPSGAFVVLLIEDVIDFVSSFWACVRGGFVAVPLNSAANHGLPVRENDALVGTLRKLAAGTIVADQRFSGLARSVAGEACFDVIDLDKGFDAAAAEEEDGFPADPTCLIATSGATGHLKLAALGPEALLHRAFPSDTRVLKVDCDYLGTFPMDGVAGGLLLFPQCRSWLQMPRSLLASAPTSLWDAVEQFRIGAFSLTNSLVKRILTAAESADRRWDLGSLEQIGVGGESVAPGLMRKLGDFLARHGARPDIIRAGYGTTETGSLVTRLDPAAPANDDDVAARLGSCLPGVSLRIVGDDDQILAEGEAGDVQVLAPQKIFAGYWAEPQATRESFTADGWWRTGDVGWLVDGQLTLRGRRKEIIIVHGHKISLPAIDAELQGVLPFGVGALSCVVQRPGDDAERLAIALVRSNPSADVSKQLVHLVRRTVAHRFQLWPTAIVAAAADQIPLTASGKLHRSRLAELVVSGTLGLVAEVPHSSPAVGHVEPSVEFALAVIWREVLGISGSLDRWANFFDLGGDSMRVVMLQVALEERFVTSVAQEAFFADPTFDTLVRLVDDPTSRAGAATARAAPIQDRLELIRYLEDTFAAGLTPDCTLSSPNRWGNACHELLEAGRTQLLEYAVRPLAAAYPDIQYLSTIVAWFDSIPQHLPDFLPFSDDVKAEIQVVRRPDCEDVLFCFCAMNGTLGVPLNLSHEWLGRLPVTLVYIKDFRDLWGGGGYPTLADGYLTSADALHALAKQLGAKRIFTLGVSLGGYPAIFYGLKLGAEAVLSLGGWTDLTPEFVRQHDATYQNLLRLAPDYAINLRTRYEVSAKRPRVLIAYGGENPHDRRHAERMNGLPGIDLLAVDNCAQHNVTDTLMRRKEYTRLLQNLLALRAFQKEEVEPAEERQSN